MLTCCAWVPNMAQYEAAPAPLLNPRLHFSWALSFNFSNRKHGVQKERGVTTDVRRENTAWQKCHVQDTTTGTTQFPLFSKEQAQWGTHMVRLQWRH